MIPNWPWAWPFWNGTTSNKFSVSVKKMGEWWTGGVSKIIKAKSFGEESKATGSLVSNFPHPRVHKTKQHRSVLKSEKSDKIIYETDIRFVSKSYVDTYLRQPMTSEERKCIRGNEGECMLIDPSQKFVEVEYMLPCEKEKNINSTVCKSSNTDFLLWYHDSAFECCCKRDNPASL